MRPQIGEFYYHFKHDPALGLAHHAYEVIGLARDTETEEVSVVYKPYYELDFVREVDADFCARPLSMWFDQIDRDGYSGPRFIKIEDVTLVEELRKNKSF